jgi:hypothetical protein
MGDMFVGCVNSCFSELMIHIYIYVISILLMEHVPLHYINPQTIYNIYIYIIIYCIFIDSIDYKHI